MKLSECLEQLRNEGYDTVQSLQSDICDLEDELQATIEAENSGLWTIDCYFKAHDIAPGVIYNSETHTEIMRGVKATYPAALSRQGRENFVKYLANVLSDKELGMLDLGLWESLLFDDLRQDSSSRVFEIAGRYCESNNPSLFRFYDDDLEFKECD